MILLGEEAMLVMRCGGEWVDRLIDCVSGEEWAKGNAAAAAAGAHCGVTISSPRNGAQNQEQEGKKKV